jgi:sugar O-acyltransferase (sialic acid O-acetyltransferase NeuD family)
LKDLIMVVTSAGSTPRIALDIAMLLDTPIAGILQIGVAEKPFVSRLPRVGDERLLADHEFLARHRFVNGVQGRDRDEIGSRILESGGEILSLIHPAAVVAGTASVAPGCMISAGAIVNVDASIGRFCLIHSGATVDHDDVLGEAVTISPGAHLAGHVTVGAGAFVGIGASVIGGVTIGRGATVGAGAVVLRDVGDGATVVGNPARPLARRSA